MLRLAVAATLAATLVFPVSHPVEAQSKSKSALRDCRTKAADGKLHKWKCKADQPCCFNASIGKGVCGSPVIGCF